MNVGLHVLASDRLPAHIKLPCAIIANTDPSNRPGQHWVAIYIDQSADGEYLDTFGRPPEGSHLKFIQKNAKCWKFNSKVIQNPASVFCGKYCLVYLYFRINNIPISDFLNIFDDNLENNDHCLKLLFDCYFTRIDLTTLSHDLFNIVDTIL